MRILRPLAIALALCTLLTPPAFAQTATADEGVHSNTAFGVRAGYTGWDGVSQLHIGAHLKLGEIFPNVRFTPNVEAGFGSDVTIITINGDLAYNFTELVEHPWSLYGGGSLSFNYFKLDGFDSATDLGLSLLMGLEHTFANEHEGLVEVRIGVMDSPDFKLTFGYTLF